MRNERLVAVRLQKEVSNEIVGTPYQPRFVTFVCFLDLGKTMCHVKAEGD